MILGGIELKSMSEYLKSVCLACSTTLIIFLMENVNILIFYIMIAFGLRLTRKVLDPPYMTLYQRSRS